MPFPENRRRRFDETEFLSEKKNKRIMNNRNSAFLCDLPVLALNEKT